ncbi:MAG: beta-lactamase family protein [Lewinellaceae bacterium]|nr:beta-lactamase family protein [Saprospiraceae bacterium]MCB9339663.1 beta-lactamase family protein [Lewinellaceae bacterium]
MNLKLQLQKAIACIAIAIFLVTAFGCKKEEPSCLPGDKCHFIQKFQEQLDSSLAGTCAGYSYSIYLDGKLENTVASGFSKLAIDGGPVSMDNTSRIHIASMSKTVSAVTVLKLLQDKGLSVDDNIIGYLPQQWDVGPNIEKITFRQLLTHTSGFRETAMDLCVAKQDGYEDHGSLQIPRYSYYLKLKCMVEYGVTEANMAISFYQNANFGLLRVIIPKLAGSEHLADDEFSSNDLNTQQEYVRLVRETLNDFTIDCVGDGVYHYVCPPKPAHHGLTFADLTYAAGGFGWYMSPSGYGNFINSLFQDQILNTQWRQAMVAQGLGCYNASTPSGHHYVSHNGGWGLGLNWNGVIGEGASQGVWMRFDDGLIAVLMMNYNHPDGPDAILRNAYDRAAE